MTIERESDKEMGAGPLIDALGGVQRVHAMTPHHDGVPTSPWFAGVRPGTYVRFVPKAIVDAKPWCSRCGQPLSIETGPAWGEPMFMCQSKQCRAFGIAAAVVEILEDSNEILGDLRWEEAATVVLPRAPWWKRAWARVKECF